MEDSVKPETFDLKACHHIRILRNWSRSGAIYYTKQRSGFIEKKGLGLIHIFHGQGVRKTSSAIGLALRGVGNNLKVDFVQFMKSGDSGEVAMLKEIPRITYYCPGEHPYIMSHGPEAMHYEHAEKALNFAMGAIERGSQILICDEILDTIIFETLKKDQILDLMKKCKRKVELVLTGRYAPWEFIGLADYVTEFVQIKHAYYEGAKARKGIEF
jgi:cob(I)alamin adenosyltransferase